jgi:hypothetical protein
MIILSYSETKEKRHNPWYCKECRKLVYIFLYGIAAKKNGPAIYNIPFCPVCGSLDVVEKPKEKE